MQKVIGEFEIADILYEETELLWQMTQQYSGISKEFYDQYFEIEIMRLPFKLGM